MQSLIPMNQQEQEVQYSGEKVSTTNGGGWGALIWLVVLVAALAVAILLFSAVGGGEAPTEPVPTEAPVDPGY